jgi:hypothetical protein
MEEATKGKGVQASQGLTRLPRPSRFSSFSVLLPRIVQGLSGEFLVGKALADDLREC